MNIAQRQPGSQQADSVTRGEMYCTRSMTITHRSLHVNSTSRLTLVAVGCMNDFGSH